MKKMVKRLLGSFNYGEKGFTLVELLVVVAILGILAAVATPNLIGLMSGAKVQAQAAEKSTIQTAVDAMMSSRQITAVVACAETNDMKTFPGIYSATANTATCLYAPDDPAANFLRSEFTHGTYSCNANGVVTQITYP